jgi:hypothetical protein
MLNPSAIGISIDHYFVFVHHKRKEIFELVVRDEVSASHHFARSFLIGHDNDIFVVLFVGDHLGVPDQFAGFGE